MKEEFILGVLHNRKGNLPEKSVVECVLRKSSGWREPVKITSYKR